VTTDDHNASRSAQNNNQLARVGIYNNPEGIEILQSFFDGVVGDDSNIMKSYTNKFGNYQVRNALLAGPGGFIRMETTWQVLNDGNYRLTTAIPFGG
jgi:filamentous hemagglutinin